jgi:crotonobetainyl-CoA:carnitine CoA-transferase CaiB-like acyl-CoA transferase
VDWFAGRDICFAPVLTLKEAFDDPFLAERGLLSHDADGSEVVGAPIRFQNEPARIDPHAPGLNADSEEIIAKGWKTPRASRLSHDQ